MSKLKLLLSLILVAGTLVATPSMVQAIVPPSNLVIRLEEPRTPTSLNDFYITFVVLDIVGGRDVTVNCQKQYEGGAVTGFDTTKTLTAGGNTDTCHVTANEFNQKGNYVISVIASAGSDTDSDNVAIDYNSEYPGDPQNYSKNKINDCTYEIKFRSNDDGGKTTKIEVYRSTDTSFTADNGSRVAEEYLGSNTDRTVTNTVPDCTKNYYYAVRAFSTAGNGSGIVGDAEVRIVNPTTTTTATTPQGAIPVVRTGSILGASEEPGATASEAGRVLGEQAMITDDEATPAAGLLGSNKSTALWIIGLGIVILVLATLVRRNRAK